MPFDRAIAAKAARLSELIYLPIAEMRDSIAVQFEFINKDDTQCGLFQCDDATYIVFRGTEASNWVWADIFSNMKMGPTPWMAGGFAHSGYAEAVFDVAADIVSALPKYPRPWIVTGHSLGGCLATLFSSHIGFIGMPPDATYTFGAPKCFNAEAARTVPEPFYRLVYKKDIAPTYPADWTGYVHPLQRGRWHLTAGGVPKYQIYRWGHTLRPWFNGTTWGRAKRDHKIENYVNALKGEA